MHDLDHHFATMSEDEPLYHFDSEDSSISSSSSSSSSTLSSFTEPHLAADEDPYFDDYGTGFHILKPDRHDIESFYHKDHDVPSPVHTFQNSLQQDNMLNSQDIKEINQMKDDLIHERYERYADHNQDHKFFDNMQDEL